MTLAAYVVLDGFDLGAGVLHLSVAHTDRERRIVLRSIGPLWDGNEVWLLAAAGTIYFAFPVLYASSFSGFYLPLTIILWLLILRGIAIEFRNHLNSPVWAQFWDAIFSGSSMLLAFLYGVALGNVVRGVPLDGSGYFFEALWTNFSIRGDSMLGETGVLDWYTVLVGLAAFFALKLHGSLWLALKTEAELNLRANQVATRTWRSLLIVHFVVTTVTFYVQPEVPRNLSARPWGFLFVAVAVLGLGGVRYYLKRSEVRAFLASCAYLVGTVTSVAFGLYPLLLPATTSPAYSLSVHNAHADDYGMRIGLTWWVLGMILVAGYFVYMYWKFAGKVGLDEQGY